MLTRVLIIFFICLILYQAFLAYSSTILKREGLENEGVGDGSSCSSSVLAYKNSGAIQLLVNQQAQAATQLAGNKPVETSGLSSVP